MSARVYGLFGRQIAHSNFRSETNFYEAKFALKTTAHTRQVHPATAQKVDDDRDDERMHTVSRLEVRMRCIEFSLKVHRCHMAELQRRYFRIFDAPVNDVLEENDVQKM